MKKQRNSLQGGSKYKLDILLLDMKIECIELFEISLSASCFEEKKVSLFGRGFAEKLI